MRMDVDPARQRRTDIFDRRRLPNARRMVVDQVLLELLDLLVAEHRLRKLADAGVRAVHDFLIGQLLLQHRPADLDPLQGRGGQLHFLVISCNGNEFFDRKG